MNKRLIYLFSAVGLLALLLTQSAQVQTDERAQKALPNFDLRQAADEIQKPRLVALQAPLSAMSKLAPTTVARRFLQTRRDVFQLGDAEINQLTTAREYRDEHNGVTHVTLQQAHQGIPVFQGEFTAHIARDGSVMAASATTTPNLVAKVNATQPTITSEQAVRVASDYAAVEFNAPLQRQTLANKQTQFKADKLTREVTPELVYFTLTPEQTRLAWQMTLWLKDSPDVYLIVLDAERGSLLYRQNLTNYEQAQPTEPHGPVFTGESPRPNLPLSLANPPTVERTDTPFRPAAFNGKATFATGDVHYDWWTGKGATQLISNNTSTYLDRDGTPNSPDQPRVMVENGVFNFPLDLTLAPTTEDYQKAAQTNLFYWVNRYHDILYTFGFTEAAGNFQTSNFNLGGRENDAINAEAQDGSGTNNANFSTPADGGAGRVQMFLWTGNPQRDGDFDQGVIIHELTHGLSNRLIGNATGLTDLQGGGMGEGWSDYFGIVLLAKETDNLDGSYAVGQYVTGNYQRGIRRFPYSSNKAVYPYTFGDVRLTTAVHPTGEIWCNTLLEMRASLIRQYGFQEGQRQSIQLVVDGMKLSPRSPSFLDARNAILLADKVNNGGANQCMIWQAFSRRGLGASASTLGARDNFPLESFDAPAACNPLGTIALDRKSYLLGETMRINLGDRNATGTVRVRINSTNTNDEETVTLAPDATQVGAYAFNVRINAGTAVRGDGIVQASLNARDKITLVYEDADYGAGATASVTVETNIAGENRLYDDDFERGNRGWQSIGTGVTWGLTSARSASSTTSWTDSPGVNYVSNADASLISPPLDFSGMDGVTLAFAHSYTLENGFDYGYVEASVDDGATWARLSGYTGTLAAFTPVRLNLDGLAGLRNVRLRFRLFTDTGTNLDGWYVDDIRLIGRQAATNSLPPNAAYTPTINEIVAAFGAPAGGNAVRILGANFSETADTKVFFGAQAATNVVVVNGSVITCNVPASPQTAIGPVTVRVENRYGAAQLVSGYQYYLNNDSPPTLNVLSLTPDSGSVRGGTVITVWGSGFTPETRFQFGNQPAAVPQFISSQMLRLTAPISSNAATGPVNLLVTHGLRLLTTIQNGYSYVAPTPPTVSVIAPNGGEQIFTGSTITARWFSQDNRNLIRHRLELHNGTGAASRKVADIALEVSGAAQSLNWSVPSSLAAGAEYRLRVVAVDDEGAETEAFSSNPFAIVRRWQAGESIAQVVQRSALASNGTTLFSFGGRTGTASTSTVPTAQSLAIGTANAKWTALAPMPQGLNAADAAHLNGKIYIPGGINTLVNIEQKLFVYDIASNAWTTAAAPPAELYLYSLVADETRNVLYQIGGVEFTSNEISNKVWRYTPQTDKWDEIPAMTTARWGHESAIIDGKLYVCGGTGQAGGLVSAEAFDFATQSWTPLANMLAPRRYAVNGTARTNDGRVLWLIAAGEHPNTTTPYANTEAYDVAVNRWIPLDASFNLANARSLLAGATVNGSLAALAGNNGTANVATLETLPLNNLALSSTNQPPIIVVPSVTTAFVGAETTFDVNGFDYAMSTPLSLAASNLPAGASFESVTGGNANVTNRLRWTPRAEDANREFTINFTVSDGTLSDVKAVTLRVKTAAPLATVNAASYRSGQVAPEQIVSAFGANLVAQTLVAQTLPLPLSLGGTSVTVNGISAPLFFVSPAQINFLIPSSVGLGTAQVIVRTAQDTYSLGTVEIVPTVPALFTNDASGTGAAAALATADGVNFQSTPFSVTVNGKPNFLLLFATGLRRAATELPNDGNGVAESVRVTIEGQSTNVLYAGTQGGLVGLDQLNLEIPASLAGGSERNVDVVVTVNGVEANRVTIRIR